MVTHTPYSNLLRGSCSLTLALFRPVESVYAQALALVRLVEGCLCSGTRPVLLCSGVPVIRQPSCSASTGDAFAQALTLFRLVEGCLCSGSGPLPPC